MKYAIWNLRLEESNYLSGPEAEIEKAGGSAEAAYSNGQVEQGASILGYVFGNFDIDLSAWNYAEISQSEALAFVLEINPNAYLAGDGKIVSPEEQL